MIRNNYIELKLETKNKSSKDETSLWVEGYLDNGDFTQLTRWRDT